MIYGEYLSVLVNAVAFNERDPQGPRAITLNGGDQVQRRSSNPVNVKLFRCDFCGAICEVVPDEGGTCPDARAVQAPFASSWPVRPHRWGEFGYNDKPTYEACTALVAAIDSSEVWLDQDTRLVLEPAQIVQERLFTEHLRVQQEKQDMSEVKVEKQGLAAVKSRVLGSLVDEIPEAGWRVAGRNAINRSAEPVLDALCKGGVISRSTADYAADFVATPLGSGIYGVALGSALSAHPRAASKAWVGRLAREMRIEGWSRIGDAVVDPVLNALESIFLAQLKDSGIDVEAANLP